MDVMPRYPKLTTRIPADLWIKINKRFKKRGELSKVIVKLLKDFIDSEEDKTPRKTTDNVRYNPKQ